MLNDYIKSPVWGSSVKDKVAYVTLQGTAKDTGEKVFAQITVKNNPDDPDGALISLVRFDVGDSKNNGDDAVLGLLNLFFEYDNGTLSGNISADTLSKATSTTRTWDTDASGRNLRNITVWQTEF